MESFNTNFAKAVEDLSANIFIPALISAYLVEIGPLIQRMTEAGLLVTYLIVVLLRVLSARLILVTIMYIGIWFCKGNEIGPYIGVVIMPLGFAGLFPEQFQGIDVPYTQVTGVAILAWAFMLVKGKRFFRGAFWSDF